MSKHTEILEQLRTAAAGGMQRAELLLEFLKLRNYSSLADSLQFAEEAIVLFQEAKKYKGLCRCYLERGMIAMVASDHENALHFFERSLTLSNTIKDPEARTTANTHLAYYYGVQRDNKNALVHLLDAQQLAEEHQLKKHLPTIYHNIAHAYFFMDNRAKAIQYSERSIEVYKAEGNKVGVASNYQALSNIVQDAESKIQYAHKALDALGGRGIDHRMEGHILWNLSEQYAVIKKNEAAVKYGRQAVKAAEQSKYLQLMIKASYGLALVLLLKMKEQSEADPDSAATIALNKLLLEETEALSEKITTWVDELQVNHMYFNSLIVKARIATFKKEHQAAITHLNELKKRVDDSFTKSQLRAIEELFYENHKALNDFKTALQYYEAWSELNREIEEEIRKGKVNALQTQFETKEKEAELERLQEMEALKTRFFSQITHELRTPITLIKGPAQQIQGSTDPEKIRHSARIIERNADRLLLLVNQLLDLSKLEAGKMVLNNSKGSLPPFIGTIVEAFQTLAKQQQIQLGFISDVEELFVRIDIDKIEKVLYNLLSNAFKFTPAQGRILCELECLDLEGRADDQQRMNIRIRVSDTGKGIAEAELPHIFDRFYQADNSHTREAEGTGIGLSLVKEIIELMEGEISVASTLGAGTTFTIELPVIVEAEEDASTVAAVDFAKATHTSHALEAELKMERASGQASLSKDVPVLLVIEDNEDIHQLIHSVFEEQYIILQAFDGEQGIELAKERIPDIIISDVMMPKKDGYEVCRTLKSELSTSHIPIVLLTAKSALPSRLAGLERGADAYLTKPFNVEELRLQIRNLLATRNKQQQKFSELFLGSTEVELPQAESQEQAFLQQVIEIINAHIDDFDFSVQRISEQLYLSHSQFYRKIQALTNASPSQFLRNVRLAKGKTLLEAKQGNVSEVAYRVGLNPGYFTKCFTKQYGYTPSSILSN